LEFTPSERSIVVEQFDSYIKTCCRNELRNIAKYNNRIRKHEISVRDFVWINSAQHEPEVEYPDFVVKGYRIAITDPRLLTALESLKDLERELILLLFFVGCKPNDLTEEFNVGQRTIYNRQNKILRKLKRIMEGEK
jgi:RNA polymerase sigma factor (sigma-70 family)